MMSSVRSSTCSSPIERRTTPASGLRVAGDRAVGERRGVLHERVDPAERDGVGHEPAALGEAGRRVVAARELDRDDRARARRAACR